MPEQAGALDVEVPEDWGPRTGDDRLTGAWYGNASTAVVGDTIVDRSTDLDSEGDVSVGVGIGTHVAVDVAFKGEDWYIGALARLPPADARKLARELLIAAQVVDDDG